jgi:hypothetical protein
MSQPNINLAKTLGERLLLTMGHEFWAAKPDNQRGAIVAVLEDDRTSYNWLDFSQMMIKASTCPDGLTEFWRLLIGTAEQVKPHQLPVGIVFETEIGSLAEHGTVAVIERDKPAPKRRKLKGFGRTLRKPKAA